MGAQNDAEIASTVHTVHAVPTYMCSFDQVCSVHGIVVAGMSDPGWSGGGATGQQPGGGAGGVGHLSPTTPMTPAAAGAFTMPSPLDDKNRDAAHDAAGLPWDAMAHGRAEVAPEATASGDARGLTDRAAGGHRGGRGSYGVSVPVHHYNRHVKTCIY